MELDELKARWADHDQKLEAGLRLNRQLLNAVQMNRAKPALQRLIAGLALEAVLDFAVVVALGSFLYEHHTAARFALPAAALDLYAIAILHGAIRQIVSARQIDYGQSITTLQKQMEALRMMRIRYTQWTLLTAPLAWTPLLIVALKGFFGIDAYKALGGAFLSANLVFGLAIIPLALWLSRKFGDRMGRSPLLQSLMRDLAGHNLNAASNFVVTLSEFEDAKRDS